MAKTDQWASQETDFVLAEVFTFKGVEENPDHTWNGHPYVTVTVQDLAQLIHDITQTYDPETGQLPDDMADILYGLTKELVDALKLAPATADSTNYLTLGGGWNIRSKK